MKLRRLRAAAIPRPIGRLRGITLSLSAPTVRLTGPAAFTLSRSKPQILGETSRKQRPPSKYLMIRAKNRHRALLRPIATDTASLNTKALISSPLVGVQQDP